MSTLLAIDPGIRGAGCALFRDGRLFKAWYQRNPVKKGAGPVAWFALGDAVASEVEGPVDTYVVEVMQIYRHGRGDPNDLLELAGVGAAIGASVGCREAFGYRPREWKGTVPGDVFTERIKSWLTDADRSVIVKCAASLEHNVYDAIGLGIVHLKRNPTSETQK